MTRIVRSAVVGLLAAAGMPTLSVAHAGLGPPSIWAIDANGDSYRVGQVLVRFADTATQTDIDNAHSNAGKLSVLHTFTLVPGLQLVSVDEGKEASAISSYLGDPNVLYAELDWEMTASSQTTPYGIDLVHAPDAWSLTIGEGAKIAVLDTGIDPLHEDLPAVIAQAGFIGAYQSAIARDPATHGVHVAGIIAAQDNGLGVVGAAPGASLLIGKVLDDDRGSGPNSSIMMGMEWAQLQGAHVINLSLGGAHYEAAFAELCERIHGLNVTIIAAAGNGNTSTPQYPAAYPGVISVAAVDANAYRAPYSNYGSTISVCAPGDAVYSTVGWTKDATIAASWDGRSVACSVIAGSAPGSVTRPAYHCGAGTSPGDFTGSVSGNIAVIERAGHLPMAYGLDSVVANAVDAQAVAVVVCDSALRSNELEGLADQWAIPVIAVNDGEAGFFFSNPGATAQISLTPGPGYLKLDGTSMAAPHVSAIAGMIYSLYGADRVSPYLVRLALEQTATDLGVSGRDDDFGYGLVQAADAVTYAGVRLHYPCVPDVASLGGSPVPDGLVTADDMVAYLSGYFGSSLQIADVASLGGALRPDGQITSDDMVAFLSAYFTGCP